MGNKNLDDIYRMLLWIQGTIAFIAGLELARVIHG